ncbi:MAG: cytochrome c3 family protein, partial [Clostridiales bacterium]|nr:cytochrome c3 family protein [Clostridiales bacterium]
KGYIITMTGPNKDKPGKNQYNIEKGAWSDFRPGEKTKFCAFCHTTGYKEEGHQDGLEGIVGTWVASGIQCERCHGAGKEHAAAGDKTKINIDRSNLLCGSCHNRILDEEGKPLAKGGFIQHNALANDCVTCHNPHKSARLASSMNIDCAVCHGKQADDFKGSSMESVGKTCKDCHMPRATEGATRYHLFKINTELKKDSMFYKEPRLDKNGKQATAKDGKPVMDEFAKGFITLDVACLNCHKNKDMKWAAEKAKNIHKYGKKT